MAGTTVDTPSGPRAIESLEVGDEVFVVDEDALKRVAGRVVEHLVTLDNDEPKITLTLEDGRQVTATEKHRFMHASGEYRSLCDIAAGDGLSSSSSATSHPVPVRVLSVEHRHEAPETVYNLTCQPHHNYLVMGLLVHNIKPKMP